MSKCTRKSFLLAAIILLLPVVAFGQGNRSERFRKDFDIDTDKRLRVTIRIDAAEVNVRRSSENSAARITCYYRERDFDVYAEYKKQRASLEVEFDRHDWIDSDDDNIDAQAVIELPRGVEIDLDARIKAGDIRIDFGGLSLAAVELTTWAGQVDVDFSRANVIDMDYLRINTKIGETHLRRLGNARFKQADINGGIGEMSVDFGGEALPEAEAYVDLDIGETRVALPRDSGVKLSVSKFLFMSDVSVPGRFYKSRGDYYSHNFDSANSKLYVKVSTGLGELRID